MPENIQKIIKKLSEDSLMGHHDKALPPRILSG